MSAAAMAAFEARAGAALIRRLANATADFGGGLSVEGILFDAALDQPLGGLAIVARDITLEVLEADLLGRELARNAAVTVTRTVNGVSTATAYVLRYDPVRHPAHGTLQLALEEDTLA